MGLFRIKKASRGGAVFKITVGVFFLLLSAALIAASVVFRFDEWHPFDPSRITDCDKALTVCDKEENTIYITGREKRIWVNLDSIPQHTVDAFVALEDNRFYTHSGIDLYRIFGAAWADIKAGGYVQGASTISQQLIKLSHLSNEKTLDRKLEEAVLATELERQFSKDDIMEMYLNYIYFGGGFYGIQAAARGYFGVDVSELTLAQSAQLAGILKSPSAYAPHLDLEASVSRRNNVLKLMKENGYIVDEEYEQAVAEECVLNNSLPLERNSIIEYALDEAVRLSGISRGELYSGGYCIHTTIDSEIQELCLSIFAEDEIFPSDNAEAAVVVIDSNGGISAMLGSRMPNSDNGLNRASGIERQPGSLIKPILVYAPAMELYGYSASTVILDEPTDFGGYSPRNSDDKYFGNVTLREAVTRSLNIPAVKVFEKVGIENAVVFAEELGISFEDEELGLPLALGGFTHGVSPLEMAGAYSAFSRGGIYIEPYSVIRITDSNGATVYERDNASKRVMSEENAFLLNSMLQSVAREGTGRRLKETGLPLACKTGTSIDANGVRDAWCAAYTCQYTAAAWMGTDSAELGSLPESAVGGNNTAMLLAKLFSGIYAEKECPDFSAPSDVSIITVDISELKDGVIYRACEQTPDEYLLSEYYISGTEPVVSNPYWETPAPPNDVGWSIDENGFPVISFIAERSYYTYEIIRTDLFGEEITVFSSDSRTGIVSFKDEDVMKGGSYTYVVVAVHNGIKNDGNASVSEPSRKLRVVVPFYY